MLEGEYYSLSYGSGIIRNSNNVRIISQCEKWLIKSARLEAKSTTELLEKKMEDLNTIIYLVNVLEEETITELELWVRDECIFSLYMLKEKQVARKAMQEEFDG